MATNYRVQLIGKRPLFSIDGVPYAVWRYQLIAEAPLTFSGEVGLAFSKDLVIKDPAQYPDVDDVTGTTLQPVNGAALQYIYASVPEGGLETGGMTLSFIAPDAESSSTSVNLVTRNTDGTNWMNLEFTTESYGEPAATNFLRGPDTVPATSGVQAPPTILPYAAEPFGVYQPLIGWKSSIATEQLAGAMAFRFRTSAKLLGDYAALSATEPLAKITVNAVVDRTGTAVGRRLAQAVSEGGATNADWASVANDPSKLTKNHDGGCIGNPEKRRATLIFSRICTSIRTGG